MNPRDLEELALTTWPALQQWLYDGWVVRFADGHTRRANSVNPLHPSHQDAAAKIAQCEQWYAERKLPTVFRLNRRTAPAALDRLLDARGYHLADPSLTLHRRLDDWTLPGALIGTLRSEQLGDWLALYCQLSGKALDQHTPTRRSCRPFLLHASSPRCGTAVRRLPARLEPSMLGRSVAWMSSQLRSTASRVMRPGCSH
jgi:hypothetical protein